jgi:hypothetical protein
MAQVTRMLYGATGSHDERHDWPAAIFAMLIGTQVALASLHGGRHCASVIAAHSGGDTPPVATPAFAAEQAKCPQAVGSNPQSNCVDTGERLSDSHMPNVSSHEAPLCRSRPPDPVHPPPPKNAAMQHLSSAVDARVDGAGPPPPALLMPGAAAALFVAVTTLAVLAFRRQWLQAAEVLLSVALAPGGALLRWQLSMLNSVPKRAHLRTAQAWGVVSKTLQLYLFIPTLEFQGGHMNSIHYSGPVVQQAEVVV